MFSKQKGITPVVAITLLLLITVGAVTAVQSQFQNIVNSNDASEALKEQRQIHKASYSISGVKRTDDGTYALIIRNNGDSVFDLEKKATLMVGLDGGHEVALEARGSSCDWSENTRLQTGDTITCNTGIEWNRNNVDNNGEPTRFKFLVSEVTQDTYTCMEKSGDKFC